MPQAGQGYPNFSGKKQGLSPSCSWVPIPSADGSNTAAVTRTAAITRLITPRMYRKNQGISCNLFPFAAKQYPKDSGILHPFAFVKLNSYLNELLQFWRATLWWRFLDHISSIILSWWRITTVTYSGAGRRCKVRVGLFPFPSNRRR